MRYPQETFVHTTLYSGSLIQRRRNAVADNTLLYQLDVLKKTGRYDAFKLQWHPCYSDAPDVWPVPNHLFWDSDVAKWIEGACYFLHGQRNAEIEGAIQELVSMIRSAQQPDGYLNIHFTVVEPGKRFTNLRDMHELYNAGHLIEAALAHHDLYKTDDLMGPIIKYVELLCNTFGPGPKQTQGYPGHPEIELSLLRLYQRTHDERHIDLARYFITERGNPRGSNGKHYFDAESEARGDDPDLKPAYWPDRDSFWYYQAHKPIVEQATIEGHSVRAMYLLTAATDLVLQQSAVNNSNLLTAVHGLWRNMVDKKMYLTGGIGAMKKWEGFGLDYFLPQGTDEGGCYSETCAAIGVMMLAERLLQIELWGELGDIMELCLYNAVLTAMSHNGKAFTYVNQLASSDQDLSKREEWFTCACCPPNIMRVLGQVGGYASTFVVDDANKSAQINIHLFLASKLEFNIGDKTVCLEQKTNWPWNGHVAFSLKDTSEKVSIQIRIPGWAHEWKLLPPNPHASVHNGYITLSADWLQTNPSFSIDVTLTPRLLSPHPYTNQHTVSIARGPIVYCVEDVDNAWVTDHFKSLQLDTSSHQVDEKVVHDEMTGDEYVQLSVTNGASILNIGELAARSGPGSRAFDTVANGIHTIDILRFVPYYFRANRGGRGHMRVGIRRK